MTEYTVFFDDLSTDNQTLLRYTVMCSDEGGLYGDVIADVCPQVILIHFSTIGLTPSRYKKLKATVWRTCIQLCKMYNFKDIHFLSPQERLVQKLANNRAKILAENFIGPYGLYVLEDIV